MMPVHHAIVPKKRWEVTKNHKTLKLPSNSRLPLMCFAQSSRSLPLSLKVTSSHTVCLLCIFIAVLSRWYSVCSHDLQCNEEKVNVHAHHKQRRAHETPYQIIVLTRKPTTKQYCSACSSTSKNNSLELNQQDFIVFSQTMKFRKFATCSN